VSTPPKGKLALPELAAMKKRGENFLSVQVCHLDVVDLEVVEKSLRFFSGV
jgi:hypothetical protein